jgi:hypothetical protein
MLDKDDLDIGIAIVWLLSLVLGWAFIKCSDHWRK